MIRYTVILAILLIGTAAAEAQDDLKNIPDTDPKRELEALQVPEGYEINLFASEPMIAKPIQMNWDAQGRLWVASSTTYPHLLPGQEPNDKIYVLEDTDGDGQADKTTLFADSLLTPTGLVPGDNGVYVANSTKILHLKDTNGNGRADKRRVILTGFGTDDTHHLLHTFRWGPAGRLYMNQSIYIYSNIQTPWGIKRLHGGGIWQFEPETLKLNVFARGFINPWGHEFDRWGQSFATDGAGGQGINYVFPEAQFAAAKGAERTIEGLNPGQPKHSGLEIISGRHFPDSLQGQMIANDFRANRVNRFAVSEKGSGYASEKASDLVWTDHLAFRPVDARMGPDGALYIADWYNPIIQHGEVDFRDPRRDHKHGRIWRITAKDRPLVEPRNLTDASVRELLEALKLPEAWTRRRAKRLLVEKKPQEVMPVLKTWVKELDRKQPETTHHLLEALWVSQGLDVVYQPLLEELLQVEKPQARAAAVRVLYDWGDRIRDTEKLLAKAAVDKHPRVRREAVTVLGQQQSAKAARQALGVLEKPMDRFLDFALWKTVQNLETYWWPKVEKEPTYLGSDRKLVYALKSVDRPKAVHRIVNLYQEGRVPEEYGQDVLQVIAKQAKPKDLQVLFEMVLEADTVSGTTRLDQLKALEQAASQDQKPAARLGRIKVFLEDEENALQEVAARLIGHWKLEALRDRLVGTAQEMDRSRELRQAAIKGLALMGDAASKQALVEMTGASYPEELQLMAAAALPEVDVEKAAEVVVQLLNSLEKESKSAVLFRSFFNQDKGVSALSEALKKKQIPEVFAQQGMEAVQQDMPWYRRSDEATKQLTAVLEELGGALPEPTMPQDLDDQALNNLERDIKETADPAHGEEIYRRKALMCQSCHAIGGAGGQVGPDLSSIGASAPMDYLIESLLKPNKAVKDGYSLISVTRTDGSVASGILERETSSEVVLRNAGDQTVVIPQSQIETQEIRSGSVMPPGLTAQLKREEFIDLAGFLAELGEPGSFSVSNKNYVRRWRFLQPSEQAGRLLAEKGVPGLLSADNLTWQPFYSQVNGKLPLKELPVLEGTNGKTLSALQFGLEVSSGGELILGFNSVEGVQVWVGNKEVKALTAQTTINLPAKDHRVLVLVDMEKRAETPLLVEVQGKKDSPAQVQIASGK